MSSSHKKANMGTTSYCHWCSMPADQYTKRCQFCNRNVFVCILCKGEEWDSFEHLSMCVNNECDNCEPLCKNEAKICFKCKRAFFCSNCMRRGVCPNCVDRLNALRQIEMEVAQNM